MSDKLISVPMEPMTPGDWQRAYGHFQEEDPDGALTMKMQEAGWVDLGRSPKFETRAGCHGVLRTAGNAEVVVLANSLDEMIALARQIEAAIPYEPPQQA